MRLGFYTDYTPEIAQFAETTGFNSMELSAWPQSSLNADEITDERIKEIRARPGSKGHRDLGPRLLPELPRRRPAMKPPSTSGTSARCSQLAERMKVPPCAPSPDRPRAARSRTAWSPFAKNFTEFCAEAEDLGHPHRHRELPDAQPQDPRPARTSPTARRSGRQCSRPCPPGRSGWRSTRRTWSSSASITSQAIRDFGDRIVHVHAKDIDIDERKRASMGFYGQAFGELEGFGNGWWRFRAPGCGDVDWRARHHRADRCRLRRKPRHRA